MSSPTNDDNHQHNQIKQLLESWRAGDERAKTELLETVYPHLKEIALRLFHREAQGHTLQATAVVNEACVKLLSAEPEWQTKTHFFSFSATVMRHLLVDYARSKKRQKRGGDEVNLTLHEELAHDGIHQDSIDVIALDAALNELSQIDDVAAQAIEQRFFAGLTNKDIAELLHISLATVERKIKFAKAFLYKKLY